ncbi:alpha/beta hydrolase family protein [Streptomyces lydicus]|uniref:lipase family protein n=1 Tax=Streptomyces lydicus TaxID=47763 RepID=UPI000B2DA675|nr:lipase family protein [Streptomyces lydicus]MDC7338001.1 lipase family protein [Streptomyces lydicus]UEG92588.1 lipase family protein [Streptomyces lydicus]
MSISRFDGSSVKHAALALVCAVTVLAAAGCDDDSRRSSPPAHQHPATRGAVVSVIPVADLDAKEVAARVAKEGIDATQVRYGVRADRIVYRTVDFKGKPTTASELVAMPKNDERGLRVVSWLHGTEVYRGEVASVNDESRDRATALLFASTGRAVSAPDYLGLGKGPGIHPYGNPKATVTASVDALRATRTFARREGRGLDRRVLISGFSQGGPATMLVGRALQQGVDPYFRPGVLAPVAGPFDLSGFEAAAADDKVERSSLYLAYFATAWNRMYGLYGAPDQAFRAPYDKKVETLFDGDHKASELAAALPRTSKQLFTEAFLQKVRHPTGDLRRKLGVMDSTCDWRPDVPVHLFHARGDKDVSFANSLRCRRQLTAKGADQQLSDVGEFDHSATVLKALPQIVREFDKAR